MRLEHGIGTKSRIKSQYRVEDEAVLPKSPTTRSHLLMNTPASPENARDSCANSAPTE